MPNDNANDSAWHVAITQRIEKVRDMLLGRAESLIEDINTGVKALVALNLGVVRDNLFDLLLRMVRIEDKQDVIMGQNEAIMASLQENNRLLAILVEQIPVRATTLGGSFTVTPRNQP